MLAEEFCVVEGDLFDFALDRAAKVGGAGEAALAGVVVEPGETLGIGHGDLAGAVKKLSEVFDNPPAAPEERGQFPNTSGIDKPELHVGLLVGLLANEKMAEVEVAMMQAAGVQERGQLGSRSEQAIKGKARFEELVSGEIREVVKDDEAAVVPEVSPPDEIGGGNLLGHRKIVRFDFLVGRQRMNGLCGKSLDMPAGNCPVVRFEIDVGVLAIGQFSPDMDGGVFENPLCVEAGARASGWNREARWKWSCDTSVIEESAG